MPPRGPRGDWNRPPGNMQGGFQGNTISAIMIELLQLQTNINHK